MPKQATCHPDKPHYAKGLCRACYERERRHQKGEVDNTWKERQARYEKTEKARARSRRYKLKKKSQRNIAKS